MKSQHKPQAARDNAAVRHDWQTMLQRLYACYHEDGSQLPENKRLWKHYQGRPIKG